MIKILQHITTEIFEKNVGQALRNKGFIYDIVYSYGDAINQLEKLDEDNNCPYTELWLFCSKGDGSLPEKAKDKDSNKIDIFLQMVADFNKNGGALFLFSDNYPFVLETNLLLKEYIQFKEGKINFEMKGNYNNEDPVKRFIFKKGTKNTINGYFQPEEYIPSPGKGERLSLRVGLNTFSEGITLSYAETFDNSEDYRPFTPFAFLSDEKHKRPFILYYDPKVETGMGPIVVHGGFTSAFYDFEQVGTGRLVISIACWLTRQEIILYDINNDIRKNGIKGIKRPLYNTKIFDKWIKINPSMFSILILDVSGSMKKYYDSLFDMANKIIKKQMINKENKGVIILFGDKARAIVVGNYRLLKIEDIDNARVGSQTNFYNAFKEAEKFIKNKNEFIHKRILFLTDGIADSSQLQDICDKMVQEKFQINIVGFENKHNESFQFIKLYSSKNKGSTFEHLRKFASPNCFYTSESFEDIKKICQNIFAAE